MKICYFIQTHKNPEQIYRLVRSIKQSSSESEIVISHDYTSCYLDLNPIRKFSNVYLLKRKNKIRRGGFSNIDPYLNAINWFSKQNFNFDWLVYLSGQDYPCKPILELEHDLSQTDYQGFIKYWNVLEKGNPWGRGGYWRYYHQYYRLPSLVGQPIERLLRSKLFRKNIYTLKSTYLPWNKNLFFTKNIDNSIMAGVLARQTPFTENFICYGGYQWHTLSKDCVQYLQDFLPENKNLINYYKHTLIPEESFIQTILVNSGKFKLCNNDKRFVDFSLKLSSGRPRILKAEDFAQLSEGDFHFARKFDIEEDSKILDMLDLKTAQNIAINS